MSQRFPNSMGCVKTNNLRNNIFRKSGIKLTDQGLISLVPRDVGKVWESSRRIISSFGCRIRNDGSRTGIRAINETSKILSNKKRLNLAFPNKIIGIIEFDGGD